MGANYPCNMNSNKEYSFDLAVAGCGANCGALPSLDSDVDPNTLIGCAGQFDGVSASYRTPCARSPFRIFCFTMEGSNADERALHIDSRAVVRMPGAMQYIQTSRHADLQ